MSGKLLTLSGAMTSAATTTSAKRESLGSRTVDEGLSPGLLPLLVGLICGGLIAWLLAKVYYLEHRSRDRKLSVKQSAATTLGYVSEKVAPLLPQFPYTHKDLVFLGKGVDYVCFDGLSQGYVRQIVFLEIKTGKSTLNTNEQRIKDAIDTGRVRRETLRIQTAPDT